MYYIRYYQLKNKWGGILISILNNLSDVDRIMFVIYIYLYHIHFYIEINTFSIDLL